MDTLTQAGPDVGRRRDLDQLLHPADIEAAVKGATILELAHAVAGSELEGTWGLFPCPECELADDGTPQQGVGIQQAPGGVVVNSVEWECQRCMTRGTRWSLQDLVLTRPPVLMRFLEQQEVMS